MIVIVNYDIGNVFNVQNALNHMGYPCLLSSDPDVILKADAIILPGVGAFRDAIQSLEDKKLISVLKEAVTKKIPLLGICLGMQLLYEKSFENGEYEGLGFLKGDIVKFDESRVSQIPQMGWNNLESVNDSPFSQSEGDVYFVHSYYAQGNTSQILSVVNYEGVKVPAIVGEFPVYGMQFHPEKSGKEGLKILKAFLNIVPTYIR